MGAVAFRRINGRVVPIKTDMLSKKERKVAAVQGAAGVAGGAAAAITTGAGTAAAVRNASKFTVKSRIMWQNAKATLSPGQLHLPGLKTEAAAQKVIRKAVATRFVAGKVFKYRNPVLLAGAGVAASLSAYGATKINEALTGKKNESGKIASAAATAATATTFAVYSHKLPVKGLGKIIANTIAKMKGNPTPHKAEWWK